MPSWQKKLFVAIAHDAASPVVDFGLPEDRTVIMGTHIEL
jgi:KUP system potassium uptake protein